MALPEARSISLIGFMGTGKSSVGKALARQTGRREDRACLRALLHLAQKISELLDRQADK